MEESSKPNVRDIYFFWRKVKVRSWGKKVKGKSNDEQYFVTFGDLAERV